MAAALVWAERAAKSGHPGGMRRLGTHLWNGVHCAKQEKEGVRWLVKAAVAGDNDAAASLLQILPAVKGNARADPQLVRQIEDGLRAAKQARRT